MRITRIVCCLSLLGLQQFSLDFVKFLANEVFHERTLETCHHSLENFWLPALQPVEQMEARQFIDDCVNNVDSLS